MIALDYAPLLGEAGRLPLDAHSPAGSSLQGHPFFGAAFLFVGTLLVVEILAGQVWHRSRLRTMLWPSAVIIAGLGMLIVTYLQPTDKALHLALAFLLLLGGFFEARYRLGQIPKGTADVVVVPALALSGLVIGPIHASGPFTSNITAQAHLLAGLMGFLLAGVRLVQVRQGPSAALDATFGAGVMLLGLSLLLVQQFHTGH